MSKDRKLIALSGYNKKDQVAILDLETMKVKQTINIALEPTSEFKFSDDNKYLVTTNPVYNYHLNIWDIETGKNIYSKFAGSNRSFDLSKNNQYLVSTTGNAITYTKTNLVVKDITTLPTTQPIIYPNPVNQKVTIEFASRIGNVEYSIINQIGSIVKKSLMISKTEAINKLEMDFSIYPSGIYFVNLFTGEAIPQTIKLIKE